MCPWLIRSITYSFWSLSDALAINHFSTLSRLKSRGFSRTDSLAPAVTGFGYSKNRTVADAKYLRNNSDFQPAGTNGCWWCYAFPRYIGAASGTAVCETRLNICKLKKLSNCPAEQYCLPYWCNVTSYICSRFDSIERTNLLIATRRHNTLNIYSIFYKEKKNCAYNISLHSYVFSIGKL